MSEPIIDRLVQETVDGGDLAAAEAIREAWARVQARQANAPTIKADLRPHREPTVVTVRVHAEAPHSVIIKVGWDVRDQTVEAGQDASFLLAPLQTFYLGFPTAAAGREWDIFHAQHDHSRSGPTILVGAYVQLSGVQR